MTIQQINPLVIFFASILTSNMILSNFLGMCSYLSVSREFKTASGLGKAVTLVMVFTTAINYLVYRYVIVPLDLVYLQYIILRVTAKSTKNPQIHLKKRVWGFSLMSEKPSRNQDFLD